MRLHGGLSARAWQQQSDPGFSDLLSDRIGLHLQSDPGPHFPLPVPTGTGRFPVLLIPCSAKAGVGFPGLSGKPEDGKVS